MGYLLDVFISTDSAFNVYPSLLITTIEHKSTGQIIIQVDKDSILQNLNPFSIHIYNCTNSSVYSVELLDQLLSSSAEHLCTTKLFNDSMRNVLKNTFSNWYPYKIYANSQLSIIPQCLLELLYMDKVNRNCNINNNNNNNAEGICLNFLHPSQFTILELNLDLQMNDDNVNHVKCPIHINLKELCSSIHKTKGLWEKEQLINDHLMIKLYFSTNENSFGLIIQLIDNNNNSFNRTTIDQFLSPTLSLINSLKYLNKIHLTINQFCIHLITIENRKINQKNKSLSNHLISKYKFNELLPPQDEFIRLTIISLSFILIKNPTLTNNNNNNIQLNNQYFIINKQFIIEICLKHLQLDNWCHIWTNEYDFPVILQTIQLRKSKTICRILFNSSSLLTVSMLNYKLCNSILTNSSTVITFYLYPPNLDVYLEDSLIYDILGISNNFIQILTKFNTSINNNNNLISSSLKPMDQTYFLCRQLTIDSFKINLSLHAMLRLYLSCHSAPLHFTSFKLINTENGYLNNVEHYHHQQHDSNILSGSLIYWNSVKYLLTMHYITQMLFRSGWLVGSLDLLGNVTGLLYSLINGLNDLIHLRSSNEDDENNDGENVTMINLSDKNLFICQQNIDFSSTVAMSIGTVASDSTTFSLKYNRNVGFIYRLTQGLSSLTRRTTG